jgi:hypothetical protein
MIIDGIMSSFLFFQLFDDSQGKMRPEDSGHLLRDSSEPTQKLNSLLGLSDPVVDLDVEANLRDGHLVSRLIITEEIDQPS